VTQSLMRLNVGTTIELLGLFDIPALQHGNVIEVGTGVVGIEEACSGIRSLQATLMISLFLGEICRLTILRRRLLVVAGFVLSFVFNVGRTSLLTGIASAKGVGAIASWHDPVGIAILVACFVSLWLSARTLEKAESRKQKREPPDHRTARRQDWKSAARGQKSVVNPRRRRPGPWVPASAFQLVGVSVFALPPGSCSSKVEPSFGTAGTSAALSARPTGL